MRAIRHVIAAKILPRTRASQRVGGGFCGARPREHGTRGIYKKVHRFYEPDKLWAVARSAIMYGLRVCARTEQEGSAV